MRARRTSAAWIAAVIASAGSCTPSEPAKVRAVAAVAPASAPGSPQPSAAPRNTVASASPRTFPVPKYESLFDRRKAFFYTVTDDVDPHAIDGAHEVTRVKARCEIVELSVFEKGIASEFGCRLDPPDPQDEDWAARFVFAWASGGLWMPTTFPHDASAFDALQLEAPIIGQPLEVSKRSERAIAKAIEGCSTRVETVNGSDCYEERCRPRTGYGDTVLRACFSRDRGLETLRRENLAGPWIESWRLDRVESIPRLSND